MGLLPYFVRFHINTRGLRNTIASNYLGGLYNEGQTVCKTHLRKVQGYQETWQSHGYLPEPQTQAEAGLSRIRVPVLTGIYAAAAWV